MKIYNNIMEEWKVIPNFSNYSASNMGKIRNNTTNKILKGTIVVGYNTYLLIDNNNKSIHKTGHFLVAISWISNPQNKTSVNHINKIRHDNRLSNLEWSTPAEQMRHSVDFDKNNGIVKKNNTDQGIYRCDKLTGEKIKYYKSAQEAIEDLGVDIKRISIHASIRKNRILCGFRWQYDDLYVKNDGEKWKFFMKGARSKYYISNLGNVRNRNRLLKGSFNKYGYKCVMWKKSNKMIHILVAKKFIKNLKPNEYKIVNHLDGDKGNNMASNLEWTSSKLNNQHAIDTGLRKSIRKIVQYDDNNNIIEIFPTARVAGEKLKLHQSTVHSYCNGRSVILKYNLKFLALTDDLINNIVDPTTIIPSRKGKIEPIKKIVQYDKNNNIIEIFNSAVDAGKKNNLRSPTIHKYCKGTMMSNTYCRGKMMTNNYMFKYLSNKDDLINKKIDISTIPKLKSTK